MLPATGCFSPPPASNDTDPATTTGMGSSSDGVDPSADDTASDDSGSPGCTPPELECAGQCVDIGSSSAHCGDCNSPCFAGEVCNNGACTVLCGEGLLQCSGECIDPTSDEMHCGGCSSPCAADEICEASDCIPDCDPGLTACGSECIDTTSDDAHCSACDSPCGPGEHCMASTCVPACPMGLVECEGSCIDPMVEEAHCGAGLDCVAQPGDQCSPMELCNGGTCQMLACTGFPMAAVNAAVTFADANAENTEVGIAWDGMSYWAIAGGGTGGITEVQYTAGGALVGSYMAGIDFRALFPQGDGTTPLYARGFASNTIQVQTSPGAFMSQLDLVGGMLDEQASIAWDPLANEFIAQQDGLLSRWDATGAFIGTVTLTGYGANAGENDFPQNRSLGWAQGCYLTVNNGMLSAWDPMGNRVDTITLNGVGSNFTANLSLSVANGMVWTSDEMTWRGYQVF
ncbi:MAG: hypothetical protein KC501_37045 [Myxococcales bacterium]|nr:hypothetical protein [Myxococcales bacterium]